MNFFNYPYLGREHLKGLNEYKVTARFVLFACLSFE